MAIERGLIDLEGLSLEQRRSTLPAIGRGADLRARNPVDARAAGQTTSWTSGTRTSPMEREQCLIVYAHDVTV